jgi:CDP-alcohol phosphatidyltransferase
MSQIELTLKGREAEEAIDLYFFRPVGFVITRWLEPTRISPTHVTLASIMIGVLTGPLFYYDNLHINVAGIIVFVFADLLDSVDGQLARLKGIYSRFGRILDGLGGAFIFTSIHLFLALRLYHHGASPAIFLLALAALLSQTLQNQMADYYRLAYVQYGMRRANSGFDAAAELRQQYEEVKQQGGMMQKIFLRLYLNYTARQEALTPNFQRLRQALARFTEGDPKLEQGAALYRSLNRPLIKHNLWIATNVRMLVLFALVLLRRIAWYFWLQVLVLNLVMLFLVWRHERNSKRLLQKIS